MDEGPESEVATPCRSCEGSGRREIAALVFRFLVVGSLPILVAIQAALLFVLPRSWAHWEHLFSLTVLLGLLLAVLLEVVLVPFFLRFGELVYGIFSERGRVCPGCKGAGRVLPPPVVPVARSLKITLWVCGVLLAAGLLFCWLVAKGYLRL